MADSKKHHYIPQFILRNFTDEREKLRVKRHGQTEWRLQGPSTVGYRNNAHRVSEWINDDPSFYETRMSVGESESAPLIRELDESNVSLVPDAMKDALQRFIVLNLIREPGFLERILPEVLAEQDPQFAELPGVEQLLRDLGIAAMAWPVPGSENDPAIRSYPGREDAYAEVFGEFIWNVVRFPHQSLVLGDRLVCTYGQSQHATGEMNVAASRYGAEGLHTCDRVTVPLTPRTGLLLARAGRPQTLNPIAFNRATILNSKTFVAHHPAWPANASELVVAAVHKQIAQVETNLGLRSPASKKRA